MALRHPLHNSQEIDIGDEAEHLLTRIAGTKYPDLKLLLGNGIGVQEACIFSQGPRLSALWTEKRS